MQRRIVTSHESPSRGSSPPRRKEDGGGGQLRPSPLGAHAASSSPTAADYQKSASRRRVLFILGPILAILLIIHLVSPSRTSGGGGSGLSGRGGSHILPGFGSRSSASRRTDAYRLNAQRKAKSAASGAWMSWFSIFLSTARQGETGDGRVRHRARGGGSRPIVGFSPLQLDRLAHALCRPVAGYTCTLQKSPNADTHRCYPPLLLSNPALTGPTRAT